MRYHFDINQCQDNIVMILIAIRYQYDINTMSIRYQYDINKIWQWITLDIVSATLLRRALATHDSRLIGEGGLSWDTAGTPAASTTAIAMERG